MGDYGEEQEEKERWKQHNVERGSAEFAFRTSPSATSNPRGLAQILAVLELAGHQLGWDVIKRNKAGEITRLPFHPSELINAYQAGIDGKYHNDFVDIAKLDEYIQKKALMRKTQMMQDNTLMT